MEDLLARLTTTKIGSVLQKMFVGTNVAWKVHERKEELQI
jgi:hypothetical protein